MNRPTDQPYNIILTGPFGVGKTTIFKKLSSEMHLDCRYESVSSVAKSMLHLDKWTHTAHVDGTEIKATLWDTGNLEHNGINNVTRSYFRQAVGVILVYDAGNRETISALTDWMLCVKENFSWQWQSYITFALWENDRDQPMNPVTPEDLNTFIAGNGLSKEVCYSVSAYTGSNLFESYQSVLEKVHHRLTEMKSFSGCESQHRAEAPVESSRGSFCSKC